MDVPIGAEEGAGKAFPPASPRFTPYSSASHRKVGEASGPYQPASDAPGRVRGVSSGSKALSTQTNLTADARSDGLPARLPYHQAVNRLREAAQSSPLTSNPSVSGPLQMATAPLTPRTQFEQQEDFIGFETPSESSGLASTKGTPNGAWGRDSHGRNGNPGKRKLDDEEVEGSRKMRERERDRSTPWCDKPGLDWEKFDSAIGVLNAETKSFISYISPTPVEHSLRLWTIELIRQAIRSKWSDADVQCFGSVGTGLYLPGGDIDLVVSCPSLPAPPLKTSSGLLHHLASLLLDASLAQPSSLIVIAKARVPIVKFVTRYGGFSVDISINQKGGVESATRVRALLESFAFREKGWIEPGDVAAPSKNDQYRPELAQKPVLSNDDFSLVEAVDYGVARSMIMVVKAFLNQRGMNEVFTGGLGSYSIICLVISFLQLHPKIQIAEIDPSRNLGLLVVEFFEYYGKHFNFDEAGISLRGKGGYFNKHDKGWWRSNQPYLLSIEDPNDPSNDVSGGSHNIIRVRQTLAGAYDVITATLLHRQSYFRNREFRDVKPLSGEALPNADYRASSPFRQSILGAIIGMSRAGLRSRESNVELFESGILQDLLSVSQGQAFAVDGLGKKALRRLQKESRKKRKQEKSIQRLAERVKEYDERRPSTKQANQSEQTNGSQHDSDITRKADSSRSSMSLSLEVDTPPNHLPPSTSESSTVVDPFGGGVLAPIDFIALGETSPVVESRSYPSRSSAVDTEESRYSVVRSRIGDTPRSIAKQNRSSQQVLYVGSDSDASSTDVVAKGDDSDNDVIMGGTGGDQLTASHHGIDRKRKRKTNEQTLLAKNMLESDSSDSQGEEFVKSLLPRGNNSASDTNKDERKAKQMAKAAYWATKGKKEPEGIIYVD